MTSPVDWSDTVSTSITGSVDLKSLLAGTHWASGDLDFSFPGLDATWSTDPDTGYGRSRGEREPWTAGYAPLAAENQAAVRNALAAWSSVANLQFTEVTESSTAVGDLRFAFVSGTLAGDAQAFAYLPDATAVAGDVWFNAGGSSRSEPWIPGSYEYLAALHEIGHALGLKHPFEREPQNKTVISQFHDSRAYTLMSYSATQGNTDTWFSFEPTTPMILDIAAMQHMYGANTEHAAGDTTYTFRDRSYHQTIWDGGGTDTIVLDSVRSSVVDLRGGFNGSTVGAPVYLMVRLNPTGQQVSNLYIAFGVVIENAFAGSGDDRLTGNDAGNELRGGGGRDTLDGGAGIDTLAGGNGDDVYLDVSQDLLIERPGNGSDLVITAISATLGENIEHLEISGSANANGIGNALANSIVANAGRNLLVGGAGADTLRGGDGNDTLRGDAGADVLVGGRSNDTYFVDDVNDRVEEESGTGSGIDWIYSSVTWVLHADTENLSLTGSAAIDATGTATANVLRGNDAGNLLEGLGGNDALDGRGGADTLIGGAGADLVRGGAGADLMIGGAGDDIYTIDDAGDLVIEQPDAGQDLVNSKRSVVLGANIEALRLGGKANLAGTGNDLPNMITGNAGRNRLDGGAGADTLAGGAGADTLAGGSGDDVYQKVERADRIAETPDGGRDSVWSSSSTTLADNVEELHLDGAAVRGSGNAADNLIVGNASDNVFAGHGGNDTLEGGDGVDRAVFSGTLGAHVFSLLPGSVLEVTDAGAIDAGDGSDRLQAVERLSFSDAELSLVTSAAIRVNSNTGGSEQSPDIITLGDGSCVVAWTSAGSILFQRYDAHGLPQGGEVQVAAPAVRYSAPELAALADGGFVASWFAYTSEEGGVYVQRFDAEANPVGDRLLVPNSTSAADDLIAVAGLQGGGFVVSWFAYEGIPADSNDVYAQRFDAAGVPEGDRILVNTTRGEAQFYPDVAALQDGGFIVSWTSYGQDGSAGCVAAQRFDSGGARVGDEMQVNTTTAGHQGGAGVAALADGGFLCVWTGALKGIYLQRYDAAGDPVGAEVLLHTSKGAIHGIPSLALSVDGEGVVTWASIEFNGSSNEFSIRGLRFDADGNVHGKVFRVDAGADEPVVNPVAAVLDASTFLLAWQARDTYDYGIFARRVGGGENTLTGDDAGNDITWSGTSSIRLDGLGGNDQLQGGASGDELVGGNGDDTLAGADGADTLGGGAGDDDLAGGVGADLLAGGSGSDTLAGGGGSDAFLFDQAPAPEAGVDLVADFVAGTDRLRLDDDVFAVLDAAVSTQLGAAQFFAAPDARAAEDASDRIIYDIRSGFLYYDPDGTGAAEAVQFAVLGGSIHPVLGAGDFVIVG